jgi:shikimate dehydrogenase
MSKNKIQKLYGIIGCPVGHSLSPYMQNAAFKKLGIKASYITFPIEKEKLRQGLEELKRIGFSGFNVTIPFKSQCLRYLDRIEPVAKKIGAVNTVVIKNKRLFGYNTDYIGFIRSLKEELKFYPRGKAIFIIGAGGAARAVAFGLAKEAAKYIYIYDIVKKSSDSLAKAVEKNFHNCNIVACTKKDIAEYIKACQLLVNTSPLGMKEKDPLPIDVGLLHNGLKVYDVVYTPQKTRLVKAARQKDIKAVGGLGMLLYQGACAFKIWTKKNPPVALMRQQLLKHISR